MFDSPIEKAKLLHVAQNIMPCVAQSNRRALKINIATYFLFSGGKENENNKGDDMDREGK